MTFFNSRLVISIFIFLVSLGGAYGMLNTTLHNPIADPSRKLHTELNDAFTRHWRARTGEHVNISPVRSGTGKPVHAVIDGLNVTTFALSRQGNMFWENPNLISTLWEPLPRDSGYASPYVSTVVFLVRKGNPKGISDWNDLLRPDVEVITSNPSTSETGRWSYLAAWVYALRQAEGDEMAAFELVKKLFANVKPLDSSPEVGSAAAAFVEHGAGDILLVWENEAHLLTQEKGSDHLEIVVPSISILAEPPISMAANGWGGVRDIAIAYTDYLYTYHAQEIAAKHYYRPRNAMVRALHANRFPPIDLFSIEEVFGGWHKAEKAHFAAGGILEQIESNRITATNSR